VIESLKALLGGSDKAKELEALEKRIENEKQMIGAKGSA
jgi:hypothetical protein